MKNTVEIKINKTIFKFEETVYEIEGVLFVKSVSIESNVYVKFVIRGRDHNPPHIHIYISNEDFRFRLNTLDFYKSDIIKNKGFVKLKNNKLLYKAILSYFEKRKQDLIDSFYVLNPTLKS